MRHSVPVSAAILLAIAACSDDPSRTPLSPGEPQEELVDLNQRQRPELVNAHVYGSFAIRAGGSGPSVITAGPANFPGHPPAGPGTCRDGLWINAQGKPTAGSLDHPHPHCITESSVINVVLEPISSCYTNDPRVECGADRSAFESLVLGADMFGPLQVFAAHVVIDDRGTTVDVTRGSGYILGYAIDAATLRTTPRRVGYIFFDLGQLGDKTQNLFAAECSLDSDVGIPCINRVVYADYKPFEAPDGVGDPATAVPGFLWFTSASTPYNYGR